MSGMIEIEQLRELLRYEPETGKLFWLERDVSWFKDEALKTAQHRCNQWNSRCAGKEAFTAMTSTGARQGRILGQLYYAHRVAYALHHGEWPTQDIDHINGDRADNRAENMRDVDHQQNMLNKKLYKSNKSGVHGVSLKKRNNYWQAYLSVNGRRRHIGNFKTVDDAITARKNAEKALNVFHPNHGRAA